MKRRLVAHQAPNGLAVGRLARTAPYLLNVLLLRLRRNEVRMSEHQEVIVPHFNFPFTWQIYALRWPRAGDDRVAPPLR